SDAKRLTSGEGPQKVYGFGLYTYGWFFEQFLASQDALYANNNNGRTAPATQAVFNAPAGQAALDIWKQGIQQGWLLDTGRNGNDDQNAFRAGRFAMTL